MEGFQAYKFYLASKLHFNSDKYDVFKSRGAVKVTRDSYYRRPDKMIFETLAKKFNEPRELIQYYVSNLAYGNDNLIYTIEESEYNYKQWKKVKQSITKFFKDDLEKILETCEKHSKLYLYSSASEPILFKMYLNKEVCIETVTILNSYVEFIPKWKNSHMMLLWESEIRKIDKSRGFVKFDRARTDSIYEEFKMELDKL